ncbi:CBS domain-containing protein [Vulgatibacter sp.]|uniref:CBS domain-containing protein n=1 Tax=Vulgatibacter sp. TaxID=1971226 RepID=UPI0035615E6E
MATYEQGKRGNGRGAEHDREEMMRDPETMGWRGSGRDVREDLDRRTHRDEIDRRHDWHARGEGGMREGGFRGGGMRAGMREAGYREDLDHRTMRDEIDRRHDWHPHREGRGAGWLERGGTPGERFMRGEAGDVPSGGRLQVTNYRPERSYGGGAPSGYGSAQYGSDYYGSSGGYGGYGGNVGYGGYGGDAGGAYGGYETGQTMGPSYSGAGGGYGGYAGDEYSGSYGGMGPGPDGRGRPAASFGGPSGAGSLAGTFGETAGWVPERQGMRPSSFALHSMMMEGREPRREEWMGPEQRRGRWEREGALVRDVMTRNPKTVHPDSPIHEAARLMRDEDTGFIPVVEDGRVIGMVTDRDIALRIVADRKDQNTQVRHVMSSDVHVCTPDDRLTDAVRVMGEENVRRLPVVDRDDHLKGVISMSDVAREADLDYALQEALEQVAARRSFWSRW